MGDRQRSDTVGTENRFVDKDNFSFSSETRGNHYQEALAQKQRRAINTDLCTDPPNRRHTAAFRKPNDEREIRYLAACKSFWDMFQLVVLGTIVLVVFLYFDWWPDNIGLLFLTLPLGGLKLLWDLIQVLRWKKWGG